MRSLLVLRLLAISLLIPLANASSQDDEGVPHEHAGDEVVEFEIGGEELAQIAAEVIAAVTEHTGVSLEGLVMRVAQRSELRDVLRGELEPQFAAMFADPTEAQARLEESLSMNSQALLAKFAMNTGEVLICERNITSIARILKQPRLTSREVLRVVMLHEAVHASDERTYAFSKTLTELDSVDKILAFSAVMEGHAQFVARQVAAVKGWSSEFEYFTDMIDEAPKTGDAAIDYFADVRAATVAAAYHDGESFIDYIVEHGGPDAIARAFREPPVETILIEEPGWYLDPASRPTLVHDFVPVLEAFADARAEDSDWNNRVVKVTRGLLDSTFALLPKQEIAPVLETIRQSHVLVQMAKDAPMGSVMIAAALFEASSSEAARRVLELEDELMHKKDEVMNTGLVKIKDAQYVEFARGPVTGIVSTKKIESGGTEHFAQTVVLRRDLVVLELTFIGDLWDEEQVLGMSLGLLQAAHRSRRVIEESLPAEVDGE